MRRREFISLIGGAVVWPFAAHAQQAPKISRIGILVQTQVERKHLIDAFKQGLYRTRLRLRAKMSPSKSALQKARPIVFRNSRPNLRVCRSR